MSAVAAVTGSDIDAIERATLAAVLPEALEEMLGWLLPFDSGSVGRAKSAVPLRHDVADPALVPQIESRYAAKGIPAAFRLPQSASFDDIREFLLGRGYVEQQPTQVRIASASNVRRVSSEPWAEVANTPDAGWASVFLGEGFDPLEGVSRVQILGRAQGSLFASVREHGQTVAVGAGAFAHGWASVHGMRTAQAHRGQGLAKRVLAALAQAALSKGCERVFLQVEATNAAAQALYRRAGFELAWSYAYWRKPAVKL